MIIKVQVTEADILAGVKFSCCRCPIALALHRAMGDDRASVGAVEVWVNPYTDVRESIRVELPENAKQFIRDFDSRKKTSDPYPQPFEFEIDLPEKTTQEKTNE